MGARRSPKKIRGAYYPEWSGVGWFATVWKRYVEQYGKRASAIWRSDRRSEPHTERARSWQEAEIARENAWLARWALRQDKWTRLSFPLALREAVDELDSASCIVAVVMQYQHVQHRDVRAMRLDVARHAYRSWSDFVAILVREFLVDQVPRMIAGAEIDAGDLLMIKERLVDGGVVVCPAKPKMEVARA